MIRVFSLILASQLSVLVLVRSAAILRREDLIVDNAPDTETVLSPEDFQEAKRLLEVDLRHAGIDVSTNPSMRADRFEGDIMGVNSRNIHQYVNDSNSFARNAIRESWRRWPNNEIPYMISSRYGTYSRRVIASAMDEYHKKTCIRFVPRDESIHPDYVYIYPDDGCYSLVGRVGGRQPLSLDSGCIQTGTVQHELMHATGFFHEQSRSDRDDYIDINFSNVQDDAVDQFEEYSLRTITLLDLPYDYSSIMHYGPYAFSKNGQRTINAKKSGAERMGQREAFSDLDLQKLNKLYECSPAEISSASSENTPAPPAPAPAATVATPVKCENQKWQCFFWSHLNYCNSYRDYMRQYCSKSCDFCTARAEPLTSVMPTLPPDANCVDTDAHCKVWSSQNYCTKAGFSNLMRTSCPRSCGLCAKH